MRRRSKRYKSLLKSIVKDKKLSTVEVLDLVKKNSISKFDESIDVSLRINLKQSKGGDFSLRTTVKLPNGSGKKERVAVLCEPDKIEEAKKAIQDDLGSVLERSWVVLGALLGPWTRSKHYDLQMFREKSLFR